MCHDPKGIQAGRLRARALLRPFHVVLVEPEIPPNTGNVARLCAATGCPLHLVQPLGFRTDAHAVRRAGLDYWHLVEVHLHPNLEAAEQSVRALRCKEDSRESWYFSGKARRSYLDTPFRLGDALVFGKESVGLPEALLEDREDHVIAIPTLGAVRSLNLANAVGIVVYEALRRSGALAVDETRR
ncbi:MAG: tRNA (cytidine(34)-2'-O)-methyltransferase [Polyangiaceae bacterium]|nr:tRNA (cytidine(34)-2'-O)-methyltransferase [Polyangiaceae bacterium]